MIDSRIKLTVKHDNNGIFFDKTEDAVDYARDEFSVDLFATEDYLYVGYYKPFNSFYIEFATTNTVGVVITAETYDGTTWVAKEFNREETKGFRRSGFISWDSADMENTTIDGDDLYWIRIESDQNQSLTDIKGLNIVFSDDNTLEQEFFQVTDSSLLPAGQSSHIMTHVATRNHIMQQLRNEGYVKQNATTGEENVTPWDILDIHEMREAAKYLALSKIFFNLSDSDDDHWWSKYREYKHKYDTVFNLGRLRVDLDDDGIVDTAEKSVQKTARWSR